MKQFTARNPSEVRCWIETTPHHSASVEKDIFVLKGYSGQELRVPFAVWDQCFVSNGSPLDKRLYRWNNYLELEILLEQRQQEKVPKKSA